MSPVSVESVRYLVISRPTRLRNRKTLLGGVNFELPPVLKRKKKYFFLRKNFFWENSGDWSHRNRR